MNAPHHPDGGEALLGRPLAPSLERRRVQAHLLLFLLDGAALGAGFGLAGWVWLDAPLAPTVSGLVNIILPLYWTMAFANRTYSQPSLADPGLARNRAFSALGLAAIAAIAVIFAAKISVQFSRAGLVLGLVCTMAVMVALRQGSRGVVRRMVGPQAVNLLVIDDGGPELAMPGALHVKAKDFSLAPTLDDPHALHRIGQALRNMDRVVISCPPERRLLWAMVLKGANVRGEIVERDVMELGIVGTARTGGVGTMIVAVGPLGLRARILKRTLDLAITVSALALLALPMLLAALLIRLEDGGPALFVQQRIGRGNRFFRIYKFRTMRACPTGADGARSAARDDDRITRIGRILRATSLDELPQLLNVLKGDMSLVGPRPHAIGSQAGDKLFWEVDERYWQRHSLKPGLSGLAQVRGLRGATDHEDDLAARLQADLEYLEGWTLLRDLRIIASTLRVLMHERAF